MPEAYTNCPNCHAPIKSGVFNSNQIISNQKHKEVIQEFTDNKAPDFCEKCGPELYEKGKENCRKLYENAEQVFNETLKKIPVITLQNPYGWDYTVLGLVTAQSVTGTGVISELSSSITDFFGMQSNRYNSKLKNGEVICSTTLRLAAFNSGGNAVIATDIDYAEVGGDKGMLMVCMSGTAVKLKNVDVLGAANGHDFDKLVTLSEKIRRLQKVKESF